MPNQPSCAQVDGKGVNSAPVGTEHAFRRKIRRGLAVEAAIAGIAYGSLLCWVTTCLVGSLHGSELSKPYWPDIPKLRTDTCGIAAFLASAVAITMSEYLRLKRADRYVGNVFTAHPIPRLYLVRAAATTAVILSTGLVLYISANAVTHPVTLSIHVTHFQNWPSEGTVRVSALLGATLSYSVRRYCRGVRKCAITARCAWSSVTPAEPGTTKPRSTDVL